MHHSSTFDPHLIFLVCELLAVNSKATHQKSSDLTNVNFSFRISIAPFYINVQALKQHHKGIWGVVRGQCLGEFYIKLMSSDSE